MTAKSSYATPLHPRAGKPTRERAASPPIGRMLLLPLLGIVVVVTIVITRALSVSAVASSEHRAQIAVDAQRVAEHLAGAIRFQTVFHAGDLDEFSRLHQYLAAVYPRAHAQLARETIQGASLLYEWTGQDRALAPLVLMAHFDVVPVAPGSEGSWTHPPYSGAIADGFVYGRGVMDDKAAAIAIFEAVEQLLQEGYTPKRTVYLSFGADEEVGGASGTGQIVQLFQARKIPAPFMVLDEGGALMLDELPGIVGPTAAIGIAEKGYLSLELSVEGPSGHSSTPILPTQIGRLSTALAKLEAHQFPARMEAPTLEMLRAIAPLMPFSQRVALANLWLFSPIVLKQLLSDPEMATLVRTTTAPTVFNAGAAENVLPANAKAIVNFQILTGETIESVTARVRAIIADPAINVKRTSTVFPGSDPSPVSDVSGPAFEALSKAVRQTLGETPPWIMPYLSGPTDSRYWCEAKAPNVYRFTPFLYEKDWSSRAHGINERLSVQTLADGVRFYQQLIRNVDAL